MGLELNSGGWILPVVIGSRSLSFFRPCVSWFCITICASMRLGMRGKCQVVKCDQKAF